MSIPKQRKVSLINVSLPRYAGKALKAGEPFEATRKDAKALVAIRMATYGTRDIARKPKVQKQPPPPAPDAAELVALRAEYEGIAGQKAHNFWKADTLKTKIDALKAEAAKAAAAETSASDDDQSDA